jgi:hypothetical protein
VSDALRRVRPQPLVADASYDAERLHEFCRERWQVNSWIPLGVWSEWPSARPLAFPEEGDAEGVPSALARGIVPKWAEANHRVAIDGGGKGLAARRYTVSHSWGRGGGKNCRRMVMYSAGATLSATVEDVAREDVEQ